MMFTFQVDTTTQNIEKAFLQNNPKILYSLFSSKNHVSFSLPEPISFSDQLSDQQAYFFFKKIFSSFSTLEFYSENPTMDFEETNHIYKARWSFKDKKTRDLYVFHIFFYLVDSNKSQESSNGSEWKITEIKAEIR